MKIQLLTLTMGALLAGCATSEPAATAAAAPTAQTTAGVVYPTGAPTTGSRIIQRSTDRSVRVIGNQDAKDDMRDVTSLGNNPSIGMRSN